MTNDVDLITHDSFLVLKIKKKVQNEEKFPSSAAKLFSQAKNILLEVFHTNQHVSTIANEAKWLKMFKIN